MRNRLFIAVALPLLISIGTWAADGQLKAICPNCAVSIRSRLETIYLQAVRDSSSTDGKQALAPSGEKEVFVIFEGGESFRNNSGFGTGTPNEASVFNRLIGEMDATPLGSGILKQIKDNIKSDQDPGKVTFKLFHPIAVDSLGRNEPLWTLEERQPHDLFGFFSSDGKNAIVGLSNYQPIQFSAYTQVHETFHLVDGWLAEREKNPAPFSDLDHVMAEYRSVRAELEFYRQFKEAHRKRDLEFRVSKFHESLLSRSGEIDDQKLFDKVLATEFPTKLPDWVFKSDIPPQYFAMKHRWAYGKKPCADGPQLPIDLPEPLEDIYSTLAWMNEQARKAETEANPATISRIDHLVRAHYTALSNENPDGKKLHDEIVGKNTASQQAIRNQVNSAGGLQKWLATHRLNDLAWLRTQGLNRPPGSGLPSKSRPGGE